MQTASTASLDLALEPAPSVPESGVAAAIATLDGEFITAGLADVAIVDGTWTIRLARLDRPGVVASMFFAQHLREVLVRLEDGREGRARIARTTFVAGQERECRLIGLTPLRHASAD
jgi:uncharacterized protein (DUF2336 family)